MTLHNLPAMFSTVSNCSYMARRCSRILMASMMLAMSLSSGASFEYIRKCFMLSFVNFTYKSDHHFLYITLQYRNVRLRE